jgi:hypothetical protein
VSRAGVREQPIEQRARVTPTVQHHPPGSRVTASHEQRPSYNRQPCSHVGLIFDRETYRAIAAGFAAAELP